MTYLDDYQLYSESNEAPTIYHKWAGLSSLSHLIGPRVWTHVGGFLNWYPGMFVVLVGIPGLKKTTALRQALQIIREVPLIGVAPTSTSKENLVDLLDDGKQPYKRTYTHEGKLTHYSQMAVFASEIVSFLNGSGNAMGMIEFLTEIWDSTGHEYKESFKNKGRRCIVNPYISLLACLTPSTMQGLISNKTLTSGMSRRCVFIYADKNAKPKAFIEVSDAQNQALTRCIEHAKRLQDVAGKFEWEEEAKAFYVRWYDEEQPKAESERSEALRFFLNTKPEYVNKISMLLQLANYTPQLMHTKISISTAIKYVEEVQGNVCRLFENAGRNELTQLSDDLERYILHNKKVRDKELYVKFFKDCRDGDTKEIDRTMDHLIRAGRVRREETIDNKVPMRHFIWTGG